MCMLSIFVGLRDSTDELDDWNSNAAMSISANLTTEPVTQSGVLYSV